MVNLLARMRGFGGKAGNYAYVTARVRAKKNLLLPQEQYAKLLARDASEIARALQEGQYKAEIDELASRYRGAELVERATRLSLGRVYGQIQGFSTGALQGMITLYLGRYDVYNVKTILRGKFARASSDEIVDETIPAGVLAPRLEALSRLETMDEVVAALRGTPFHRVLQAQVEGRQLTNLVEVENALDHEYYALLAASVPRLGRANQAFLSWIRNEIDIVNLKTLLRLRFAGVADWEPYFLADGNEVDRETAARIMRGSDEEIIQEVSTLSVDAEVVEALRKALADRVINPLATALEKEFIRDASDFSHRAPLSVLPVIDFILRKKIEVDNIRAIAYGKQTGLETETIQELLIL